MTIALLGGGPGAARAEEPTPAAAVHESYAEFGVLETRVRHFRRPSCWSLVLRGTLANPYDEPAEGARLIVRLRISGEEFREVERLETELDRRIAPRAEVPFNRELTTACTSVFTDISVVAFATSRAGVELPLPSPQVEIAAAQIEEASHQGGGFAPIPSVGGWTPDFGQ